MEAETHEPSLDPLCIAAGVAVVAWSFLWIYMLKPSLIFMGGTMAVAALLAIPGVPAAIWFANTRLAADGEYPHIAITVCMGIACALLFWVVVVMVFAAGYNVFVEEIAPRVRKLWESKGLPAALACQRRREGQE